MTAWAAQGWPGSPIRSLFRPADRGFQGEIRVTSLHVSPRGEAKCVRGPSGRGASRLARAGVLDQYVEHGKQAQRSPGARIACFDRRVVRNAGWFQILRRTLSGNKVPQATRREGLTPLWDSPLPGPLTGEASPSLAVRVKSPVEGAAGSCGRSARSEEDGDPGDLLRRTTKPTAANVRRPKGYAPLPLCCAESAAPRSWNG